VGGVAGDPDQRVGFAVNDQLFVFRRLRQQLHGFAPDLIALAIGRERPDIEHAEQAEAVQLGRQPVPLVEAVAG